MLTRSQLYSINNDLTVLKYTNKVKVISTFYSRHYPALLLLLRIKVKVKIQILVQL